MNSRQQPVVTAAYYYHPYRPHSYHDPAFASLAYRPLQYQAQLGGLPTTDHQQQQQGHLSSLAAAGFQQPNFRLRHHHRVPLLNRQPSHPARAPMAFEQQQPAQGMSEDELAELQKASNEYQPEATVCVVALELRKRSEAKLSTGECRGWRRLMNRADCDP